MKNDTATAHSAARSCTTTIKYNMVFECLRICFYENYFLSLELYIWAMGLVAVECAA